MAIIRGTVGSDRLTGAERRDRIVGFAGNDTLDGASGDDILDGGADNDTIVGGLGDDRISGGGGDDNLSDIGGSDLLDGGAGNDRIRVYRQSAQAIETVTIAGGDGADQVDFGNLGGGTAAIDLGDGDDRIFLYGFALGMTTITAGAGRDTIAFYHDYAAGTAPVVSDFASGDSGDRLDILDYLGTHLIGWQGARNPFARGFMRVVQDGDDALLQIDPDGSRRGEDFMTFVTLVDVDAAQMTAANFSGFAPDGGTTVGIRVMGTQQDDTIYGSMGRDRIAGGAGDDYLTGDVGHDLLDGGEGADTLRGGAGNDRMYGGDGDDIISDDGGSNFIDAGAGDDRVLHLLVSGGTSGGGGVETILTGAGRDHVQYQNDRSGTLTLNLGSEDDVFDLYTVQDGGALITTGSGHDTITFRWDGADHVEGILTVTDFSAGAAGDTLMLRDFLTLALTDWNGGDPFASGHLRLIDADGATSIEIDRDGNAGTCAFATLVRLEGVAAEDLTSYNLDVYAPAAWMIAEMQW